MSPLFGVSNALRARARCHIAFAHSSIRAQVAQPIINLPSLLTFATRLFASHFRSFVQTERAQVTGFPASM